jgi:hypothetical protein
VWLSLYMWVSSIRVYNSYVYNIISFNNINQLPVCFLLETLIYPVNKFGHVLSQTSVGTICVPTFVYAV